jgi:hypothetical protein
MYKEQNECGHEKLAFGSGDFYIFCMDCTRSWVHIDPIKGDNSPSYDHSLLIFANEYRVKFPDNLTFIETKAQEKGLI